MIRLVLALPCLLLLAACPRAVEPASSGSAEPSASEPAEPTPAARPQPPARTTLDEAIEREQDPARRGYLVQFAEGLAEGDRVRVTDHPDRWEIVVSHRSEDGMTGGAEQYFIDKATGETEMGWHEHPMEMPEVIEETKVLEP